VILNMSDQGLDVSLPSIPGRRWHVALDTSDAARRHPRAPPPGAAWPRAFRAGPRSVVVLERGMSGDGRVTAVVANLGEEQETRWPRTPPGAATRRTS